MTKLIRKTQQPSDYPSNQIHDAHSTSTTDTYTCNYINGIDENVGNLTQLNTTNKNNLVSAINSVVESGSNENGNWIKYADGTMICTKTISIITPITSTWGAL